MTERTDWISTAEARVATIALNPDEASPWHFHTHILERVVCLSGRVEVQYRDPVSETVLEPGGMAEIQAARAHRLVNLQSVASTYLLIQTGVHDFIPIEP